MPISNNYVLCVSVMYNRCIKQQTLHTSPSTTDITHTTRDITHNKHSTYSTNAVITEHAVM